MQTDSLNKNMYIFKLDVCFVSYNCFCVASRHMCVSTPRLLITSYSNMMHCDITAMTPYDWLNKIYKFLYMPAVVGIVSRLGLRITIQQVIFPRCKFCQMVSFSFSSPTQKFTSPTTEKCYASDISYKAYMGKTIICRTLIISTVIIALYSCTVTTCICICTGVSENLRFSVVYMCTNNLVSYGWTLVQHRVFIACSIDLVQFKCCNHS